MKKKEDLGYIHSLAIVGYNRGLSSGLFYGLFFGLVLAIILRIVGLFP